MPTNACFVVRVGQQEHEVAGRRVALGGDGQDVLGGAGHLLDRRVLDRGDRLLLGPAVPVAEVGERGGDRVDDRAGPGRRSGTASRAPGTWPGCAAVAGRCRTDQRGRRRPGCASSHPALLVDQRDRHPHRDRRDDAQHDDLDDQRRSASCVPSALEAEPRRLRRVAGCARPVQELGCCATSASSAGGGPARRGGPPIGSGRPGERARHLMASAIALAAAAVVEAGSAPPTIAASALPNGSQTVGHRRDGRQDVAVLAGVERTSARFGSCRLHLVERRGQRRRARLGLVQRDLDVLAW